MGGSEKKNSRSKRNGRTPLRIAQQGLISNLLECSMNDIVASTIILFAINFNFGSPYNSKSHNSLVFTLVMFNPGTSASWLKGSE